MRDFEQCGHGFRLSREKKKEALSHAQETVKLDHHLQTTTRAIRSLRVTPITPKKSEAHTDTGYLIGVADIIIWEMCQFSGGECDAYKAKTRVAFVV